MQTTPKNATAPATRDFYTPEDQLDIFEDQGDTADPKRYEVLLRKLIEKQRIDIPGINQNFRNAVYTFNPYPRAGISKYLKKANIARSPETSIARDWNNVFRDLHISFLRNVIKVEDQLER